LGKCVLLWVKLTAEAVFYCAGQGRKKRLPLQVEIHEHLQRRCKASFVMCDESSPGKLIQNAVLCTIMICENALIGGVFKMLLLLI